MFVFLYYRTMKILSLSMKLSTLETAICPLRYALIYCGFGFLISLLQNGFLINCIWNDSQVPNYGIFENINSLKELAQMPQWNEQRPLRVATGFTYVWWVTDSPFGALLSFKIPLRMYVFSFIIILGNDSTCFFAARPQIHGRKWY